MTLRIFKRAELARLKINATPLKLNSNYLSIMRNFVHTRNIPALVIWLAMASIFLLAPSLLFAANDAVWQGSDARITTTSNGTDITVRVSGAHTVDSITVDSGSFDVVLSNSALVITSPDRYKLDTSPATFSTFTCGSSDSTLSLQRNL